MILYGLYIAACIVPGYVLARKLSDLKARGFSVSAPSARSSDIGSGLPAAR